MAQRLLLKQVGLVAAVKAILPVLVLLVIHLLRHQTAVTAHQQIRNKDEMEGMVLAVDLLQVAVVVVDLMQALEQVVME